LLGNFARAFHAGVSRVTVRISDDTPDLAALLYAPEQLDPVVLDSWRLWRQELEAQFREAHGRAWPDFQHLRAEGGAVPSTAARTLRAHASREAFILEVTNWLFEKSTGAFLRQTDLRSFFEVAPCFPLFLLGWSYGSYRMALQPTHFGRKNAGAFDLLSAAYLPFCDRFVTHDQPQYRALRLIARFAPNPPRVQRWTEFRRALVPDLPCAA
jgi:hypothetical protein